MNRFGRFLSAALVLVSIAAGASPARAAGTLMVSPSSMGFGNVQVGETSAPQTANVWNSGDAPVTISSVALTGAAAGSYTVSNDTCSGQVIAPSSIGCSFVVRFAPTSVGGKAALVSITSNGTPSRMDVTLDGTGTNPSLMGPSSVTFNFSVEVGRSSEVLQAMFFNNGYGPVQVGTASITGTAASQYAMTQDQCSSVLLPQGGWCAISLRMTPTSPGEKLAQLRVPSSATASPNVVELVAQAHLAIRAFPTSYQWGAQQVGTLSPTTLQVSVQNTSTNPYTVQSVSLSGTHAGDFPLGDGCSGQTLQSNGFCSLSVGFRPAAQGPRTATIAIVTDAPGGPTTVSLGGIGLAPQITITPNPVAFGTTELGTSPTRQVTIRNDGDGSGYVSFMDIRGANPGAYLFETTCSGANLFPNGGTCGFTVRYLATTLGATSAILHIETNVGVFDVPLSGVAVDTTPPETTIDVPTLPVKASLLTSITGSATDAGGVQATTLLFEDALGNRMTATPVLGPCSAGDRSCTWSYAVPVMLPGVYTVRAFSRDRSGNLETPGDMASFVIV